MITVFPKNVSTAPLKISYDIPLSLIAQALKKCASQMQLPVEIVEDTFSINNGGMLSSLLSKTAPCVAVYHKSKKRDYHSFVIERQSSYGINYVYVHGGGYSKNERNILISQSAERRSLLGSILASSSQAGLKDEELYYNAVTDMISEALVRAEDLYVHAASRQEPTPSPQPTPRPQPAHRPQPSAQSHPAHRPQPSSQPQPAHRPQPSPQSQPAHRPQPSSQPQPAHRPQPCPRPAGTQKSPKKGKRVRIGMLPTCISDMVTHCWTDTDLILQAKGCKPIASIKRHTYLPTIATTLLTVDTDEQATIAVQLFKSRQTPGANLALLGTLHILEFPYSIYGKQVIKVTMYVDAHGQLELIADEYRTKKRLTVTFTPA